MELVPDIVSIICHDGILYNSQAAQQIHGYEEADLVGKKTFDSSVNQEGVSDSGHGMV
jgi:PAS domain S-box-containing protein